MSRPLVRLSTPFLPDRVRVDRAFPGAVRNVSLLTTGPAKGHGFQIDRATVRRTVELGEGVRGRWTHGALCADALARHLGSWSNLREESFRRCLTCNAEAENTACERCGGQTEVAHRAVGDFRFAESAWRLKPDGLSTPAPDYLMTRAEEDPASLGISIVAHFALSEAEGEDAEPLARIPDADGLLRADWVADPAANPTGLSERSADPIVARLDRLVARDGTEATKLRVFAFLARYFGDEDEEPDLPTDPAPSAEEDALRVELTALRAQVEALNATVARVSLQPAASLVGDLKRRAAALEAPLDAKDLAAVETLLQAGAVQAAHTLGQALLEQSRAQSQAPVSRRVREPLSGNPSDPAAATDDGERSLAAQAAVVRASGNLVPEFLADRSEFTTKPV